MFSVKLKIKEGRNSLPRSGSSSSSRLRRSSIGSNGTTGSLRSSLASNKNTDKNRKEKKVRIITHRERDKDTGEIVI